MLKNSVFFYRSAMIFYESQYPENADIDGFQTCGNFMLSVKINVKMSSIFDEKNIKKTARFFEQKNAKK